MRKAAVWQWTIVIAAVVALEDGRSRSGRNNLCPKLGHVRWRLIRVWAT